MKNDFFKKRQVNNKGMTLVEVLVTLAILSIMIVPIFDVFVRTKEVNYKTATTVSANFIGQKVLEDLKSDTELTPGETIRQEDDFDVTVTVKEISSGLSFQPDGSTVNNGSQSMPVPDVKLHYKKSESETEIYVNGQKYTHITNDFELALAGAGDGKVTCVFIADATSSPIKTTLDNILVNDGDTIDVVLTIEGTVEPSVFKVSNNSDYTVAFYEVDDRESKVAIQPSITTGNGEVALYQKKRSTSASGKNETQLYTIELEIRKNGILYERLVSTAKK